MSQFIIQSKEELEIITSAFDNSEVIHINKMDIANELFKNSKPLSGRARELLSEALSKSSISTPTLPDRL